MNFCVKIALITFSLGLISVAYSMEKGRAEWNISTELAPLKPFSSVPITHIPQYLYENCNQVTCYKWSKEHFERLKRAVDTLTEQAVRQKNTDNKEFTKAAEVYDWIYGLKLIESDYLKRDSLALTLEDLKKINGRITRLTAAHQEEFRKKSIGWPKKELTPTERTFIQALENYPKNYEDFIEGSSEASLKELVNSPNLILKRNQKHEITKDRLIAWALTWNMFSAIGLPHAPVGITLSMNELNAWEEESMKLADHTPGTINSLEWTKKRIHIFPQGELIEPGLKQLLNLVNSKSNAHPVVLALWVWQKIVAIHPWSEANKRTAKALAIPILLKNGYLPPLILAEDEKEYSQTLIDSFEEEGGYIPFVRFMIKLIAKTQQKFRQEEI